MVSAERKRKKRQSYKRSLRRRRATVDAKWAAVRDKECGPVDKPKVKIATAERAEMMSKACERGLGGRFEGYRCRWCGHWHVGHKTWRSKRDERRVSAELESTEPTGWYAEASEERISYIWRPVLKLAETFHEMKVYFDSYEACDEWIRTEVVGQGMLNPAPAQFEREAS